VNENKSILKMEKKLINVVCSPEDAELRPEPTTEPAQNELANGESSATSGRIKLCASLLCYCSITLVDGFLLLHKFRQSRRESRVEVCIHLSHHVVSMNGKVGAKRRFQQVQIDSAPTVTVTWKQRKCRGVLPRSTSRRSQQMGVK